MREDVSDVDDLPSVFDEGDQPVSVAADVEDRERTHSIGMRKVGAHFGDMFPLGSLGDAVPVQQRLHSICMRLAELGDRSSTDDPHYPMLPKR